MITIYETLTDSPRKQASRLEGRTTSYNLPTKLSRARLYISLVSKKGSLKHSYTITFSLTRVIRQNIP